MKYVSIIGGQLFSKLGKLSKANLIAKKNIEKVLLNTNKSQINNITNASWKNLGKTFAEFSILNKLLEKNNDKIIIEGKEHLINIKKQGIQTIFIGIHQANWELFVPTISRFNIPVVAVYRHINNEFINKFILKKRKQTLIDDNTFYTPKGKQSAKDIIKGLEKGFSIALLIDQKDSAGENIKFFGYKVKTQVGFLKLARKFNLKITPMQMIRKEANDFIIKFHKPLDLFNDNLDETNAMFKIHQTIEKWIMDNPQQWLWQHKRFD